MATALLIGINYPDTESELRGCINDVNNVAEFLRDTAGIQDVTVHDDVSNPLSTTRQGIMDSLDKLARRTVDEDLAFVWIHFSGHGSFVRDCNGDERDGFDECLCPSDYMISGVVPDDYIKQTLRRFNPKTRVFAFFDCCHSGTIADLSWKYARGRRVRSNRGRPCPGKVSLISGCTDRQSSYDAYNLQDKHMFSGVLTSLFLRAVREEPALLEDCVTLVNRLSQMISASRFPQSPQLTSSYDFFRDKIVLPIKYRTKK